MSDRPDDAGREEDDLFEALVAGLGTTTPQRDLALIVTPIASAEALAGLAAVSELACTVIPSRSGAVAAMDLEVADPFERLTGQPPKEALALAKAISILTRIDVVLLVSRLVTEEGEVSLEGELSAWRVTGADLGDEISPGLVIAGLDPTIEDLAVGEKQLIDIRGAIDSTSIPKAAAAATIARALGRARQRTEEEQAKAAEVIRERNATRPETAGDPASDDAPASGGDVDSSGDSASGVDPEPDDNPDSAEGGEPGQNDAPHQDGTEQQQ